MITPSNLAANSGLNDFNLDNIDPVTGKTPKTRVRDVKSALAIYTSLRQADESSSVNRARIDAMFDGVAPYNQAALNSTGQGARTNLNWGESKRYLDIAMSAFVDLYSSLEKLVNIKLRLGEPTKRQEFADVVAEEFTQMLRSYPEFHSNYLRLCTEFNKHGVGVSYFETATSWKFRVCGLGDFLIPRQTQASEEAIEVACARRSYLLHELYAFIEKPEVAEKLGWDVGEVRRVMVANSRNNSTGTASSLTNWEAAERELKNNDLCFGMENTSVAVVHQWVREIDGSVSMLIFAEDTPKQFMYRGPSLFKAPEQAFILFAYGVGTNGTYHSVRALGNCIFNHIQTSNRMRCQSIDAAMMSGAVMIQPESQRALEDLSFTMYGPYSILSPNIKVIEKAAPNLSQNMMPALQELSSQLAMNVDCVSTYGNQSSPYRNELQTEHDLAVASRLSGSTLNLFYLSWTRLMREVLRRVVSATSQDVHVKEFFARCAERGVPAEIVKSIDHSKTTAVRAIGAGSAANRLLALRELNQVAGGYDDVGRRNLVRDITAERVGRDLVDRYAPANVEPRTTVDAKLAMIENMMMQSGQPVAVLDSEMHAMHLRSHGPALNEVVSAIQKGEVDLAQSLPYAQALFDHCSEHNRYLAADPMSVADVKSMNQLLQIANEVVVNYGRKFEAQQRKAQEAQMAEGQPAEGPTPAELKMREHELAMQIMSDKAEADLRIKQAKADQDAALKDAANALKQS